ncbi:MAG TPA: hydrogenase accessory protein HypB, partial [Candidatus Xenobia bacterium]
MPQLDVSRPVLSKNDALAADNRARFESLGVRVINVLSSPGAGKTTLLTRTLTHLGRKAGVIV